jgi:NAD(P)H-hydrate epimerase
MSEASRHQLATLLAIGMSCCVAIYDLSDGELENALAGADLIVDAVLGYRADGPPHGEVERLMASIVESGRPVVSLDVPSGTDLDTGLATGTAISAQATLTLALPKTGLLADGAGARVGRLYLADLGLPAALYTGLGLDVGPVFAAGRIIEIDRSR